MLPARLTCSGLTGHEVLCVRAAPAALALDVHKHIAHELNVQLQSLRVVLPNGQLLAAICRAHPLTTVAKLNELGNG